MEEVEWFISFKTANTPAAGINATVYVKVIGENGVWKPLEFGDKVSKANPFARNVTSKFLFKRPDDIGAIKQIDVWHNASEEWDCEKIEIQRQNNCWVFRTKAAIPSHLQQKDDPEHLPEPVHLEGERFETGNGATPFHIAAKDGDLDTLDKFLAQESFNVNMLDQMGRTAAHYAVMYGERDVLKKLIEFKADLTKKDAMGKHTLHHAVVNDKNNEEIVRVLIENVPDVINGVDMTTRSKKERVHRFVLDSDYFGKNAMHYASSYNFVSIIDLLHKHCAQATQSADNTQQTPLHCSGICGSYGAAAALIRNGAVVDAKDSEKRTFLHHAATAGHYQFVYEVLKLLGEASAQGLISARDRSERTAIHCAAADGGLQTLQILFDNGADLYAMDEHKSTCMHHAAKKGDAKILSWLVLKLSANDKNDLGLTPLHVAIDHNNLAGVVWLLKNGADVLIKTSLNETCIQLAEKRAKTKSQSHASEIVRKVKEAYQAKQQEAKMEGGKSGQGQSGEDEEEDGAHVQSLDQEDPSDKLRFHDTNKKKRVSDEDNALLEEIARLKNEVAALKDKVQKKNQVIEILKKKLGLSQEQVDEIEEQVNLGRMCQQPECSLM